MVQWCSQAGRPNHPHCEAVQGEGVVKLTGGHFWGLASLDSHECASRGIPRRSFGQFQKWPGPSKVQSTMNIHECCTIGNLALLGRLERVLLKSLTCKHVQQNVNSLQQFWLSPNKCDTVADNSAIEIAGNNTTASAKYQSLYSWLEPPKIESLKHARKSDSLG